MVWLRDNEWWQSPETGGGTGWTVPYRLEAAWLLLTPGLQPSDADFFGLPASRTVREFLLEASKLAVTCYSSHRDLIPTLCIILTCF